MVNTFYAILLFAAIFVAYVRMPGKSAGEKFQFRFATAIVAMFASCIILGLNVVEGRAQATNDPNVIADKALQSYRGWPFMWQESHLWRPANSDTAEVSTTINPLGLTADALVALMLLSQCASASEAVIRNREQKRPYYELLVAVNPFVWLLLLIAIAAGMLRLLILLSQ